MLLTKSIRLTICSSGNCLDYFENLKEFDHFRRKVFRKKGSSASLSGICTDRQSRFCTVNCAICTCGVRVRDLFCVTIVHRVHALREMNQLLASQ